MKTIIKITSALHDSVSCISDTEDICISSAFTQLWFRIVVRKTENNGHNFLKTCHEPALRGWEADPAVCSSSSVCLPCRNCSFGNSAGLKGQWNRADPTAISPSFPRAKGGRGSVPADERDGSVW